MPIDNREERQSAAALLKPYVIHGVAPSTIDAPERLAAAHSYAGIAAQTLVTGEPRKGAFLLLGVGA